MKYQVKWQVLATFEVVVEAANEDEAYDIAREESDPVSSEFVTDSLEITEIQA